MQCINPDCSGTNADAISLSINREKTTAGTDLERTGHTDWAYTRPSTILGTSCPTCKQTWLVPDAKARAGSYLREQFAGTHQARHIPTALVASIVNQ